MTELRSAPRLCRNDGKQALRDQALAEIDTHLDNLKRCIHWLVAAGVAVIAVDMRRGTTQPRITVAGSPLLHSLYGDDCANIGRRQEGALTIFVWIGVRHSCITRWEEVIAP